MKRVICDVCGEEVGETTIEKYGYIDDKNISISIGTSNDLCKKCILEIITDKINLESNIIHGERDVDGKITWKTRGEQIDHYVRKLDELHRQEIETRNKLNQLNDEEENK